MTPSGSIPGNARFVIFRSFRDRLVRMTSLPLTPERRVSYWELFFVVGLFSLPATAQSVFLAKHPGEAPFKPEFMDWRFATQAIQSVTQVGVLYILMRRGGESLRDFTSPFRGGDVGWGFVLVIAGYVAMWPVNYAVSTICANWLGHQEHGQNMQVFRSTLSVSYLAMVLVNPLAEEGFMRVYLQTRLRQKGWRAFETVAASAILQAGYHLYQGIPACIALVIPAELPPLYAPESVAKVAPGTELWLVTLKECLPVS